MVRWTFFFFFLGSAVAMLTAQLFADRTQRDAPDGEYKKHKIMGMYL